MPGKTVKSRVWVVEEGRRSSRRDQLAAEEPLEIRLQLAGGGKAPVPVFSRRGEKPGLKTVAITMRTPGADFELAAGFLYGEGVLRSREDVREIGYCDDPDLEDDKRYNVVTVALREGLAPELAALERHFYTTSACGVCGKASLEALRVRGCPVMAGGLEVEPEVLLQLPEKLRGEQGVFDRTGGLHAAALFDATGRLLMVREDVGRHNAVDKLVGAAFLAGRLPLDRHIVLVSGRSSFEILQKCLMARVPVLCAVSAPSSLAVALAREFGMTLVGFLRGERFNVYAGHERIRAARG